MFPSVIPLYGTDCSRVTHPSAAGMFSVQALQTSPLDLHVLSTPPAFVLSQDQTLMFNPPQARFLSASGSPKPSASHPLARCLLSQNLTVLREFLPLSMENTRSLFLLCIVFKVRSPPSLASPLRELSPPFRTRSFQAAVAIISNVALFVKCFFHSRLFPYIVITASKSAIYCVFRPFHGYFSLCTGLFCFC